LKTYRGLAKKYRAWIFVALVIGASFLIVEGSKTFQECIDSTKNKEGEYGTRKGIAKITKIYSIRRDCLGVFLHENGEAITAAFTIVLALSTIALWLSTRELWRVTDETLKHSEDTSRKQLRAYVSVEPDGVGDYNPPDRIIARVRFCNTGSVFARSVATSICCELSEDGEREAFDDGKISGNNVIAPRAQILRSADEAISKCKIELGRRAAKNAGKQLYLYVWGIVQYHDGFTGGRWTRYCHRYNFSALDEGEYDIPQKNYRYHHKGNQIDDKD
jgi:hypothetical protein